jgi:lipid A 3-O-deacylase
MAAGNAQAQHPLSVSVRADNDAFNFWMPPYARPDEEYTSGVRGTLEYAGGAWWERWLHPKTVPCTAGAGPCATRTFSLGQDSYTGTLAPGDTSYVPGGRPDAGWLYVQESSRIASDSHLDETSVTIGVTGPPSLAQATQRFFHSLAPEFNHTFDWSHQLPFEPGIIVAYEHTQRVLVFGEGKPFGGDFEPHVGASLGNILTEGTAGVRARTGFRLHHPWLLAAQSTTPEVAFFIDATMHGVVRNEFLAGTMFRSNDHVQERPFVPEYQGGVSVRWRRLTAAYSVDRTGSEYSARATGHSWSRLALEWRLAR